MACKRYGVGGVCGLDVKETYVPPPLDIKGNPFTVFRVGLAGAGLVGTGVQATAGRPIRPQVGGNEVHR